MGSKHLEESSEHLAELRSRASLPRRAWLGTEPARQGCCQTGRSLQAATSPRAHWALREGWQNQTAPKTCHLGAAALNISHYKPLCMSPAHTTCTLTNDISKIKLFRVENPILMSAQSFHLYSYSN